MNEILLHFDVVLASSLIYLIFRYVFIYKKSSLFNTPFYLSLPGFVLFVIIFLKSVNIMFESMGLILTMMGLDYSNVVKYFLLLGYFVTSYKFENLVINQFEEVGTKGRELKYFIYSSIVIPPAAALFMLLALLVIFFIWFSLQVFYIKQT